MKIEEIDKSCLAHINNIENIVQNTNLCCSLCFRLFWIFYSILYCEKFCYQLNYFGLVNSYSFGLRISAFAFFNLFLLPKKYLIAKNLLTIFLYEQSKEEIFVSNLIIENLVHSIFYPQAPALNVIWEEARTGIKFFGHLIKIYFPMFTKLKEMPKENRRKIFLKQKMSDFQFLTELNTSWSNNPSKEKLWDGMTIFIWKKKISTIKFSLLEN